MADDCLVGFKFKDGEEDFARDIKVQEASEFLFSEVGFNSGFGRLAEGEDEIQMKPADFHGDVGLESFDFVEAFDFAM